MVQGVRQDEMVQLDPKGRRVSRAFQVLLDFKGQPVLLDCRVLLEHLEVLEVLARRVNQVLQESLDCLELQLLQGIQDLLGHQDLLALKVKMVTRVTKVIVVNQDFLDSLAQLDFLAEKVYKAQREIRALQVRRGSLAHEVQKAQRDKRVALEQQD